MVLTLIIVILTIKLGRATGFSRAWKLITYAVFIYPFTRLLILVTNGILPDYVEIVALTGLPIITCSLTVLGLYMLLKDVEKVTKRHGNPS